MPERQIATWKIVVGYAAFGIAAFVFFFYLTFPYDTVRERVLNEARAAGYDMAIGKLGPGLFGITATNVDLRKRDVVQVEGMPESEPGALHLDKVSVRPSVWPLGAACRANAFGGTISGAVGGLSSLTVKADLSDVDLSNESITAYTGLKLAGTLDGALKLTAPQVPPPGGKGPAEPDFGAANGSFTLTGSDVTVNGGTMVVPMYGTPTPMDLPKIILGGLDVKVDFDKGQGKIEALKAKSSDLDLQGSGTVKLARRLEYSELNVELRFKFEDELKKRLGALSMALSVLQRDPKDPTYNAARITGFLGRPNFR